MILPVSSGLLHDTDGYIQALTDYRAGDAEPIIELFIDATQKAITNAEILAQDIETLRDEVLSIAQRKTPLLRSLTDLCCTEPAFTARMVEEHTRGPGLVCIASSTAWWSCKFCVKNASKFRGKKCGLSPLSTAPSTTLQHERDGADRCASGFDNPRENSAAVGGFPCTEL